MEVKLHLLVGLSSRSERISHDLDDNFVKVIWANKQ